MTVNIQHKCAARVLGSSGDEVDSVSREENSLLAGGRWETEEESRCVGARKNKRKAGAAGISASSKPQENSYIVNKLLQQVCKMTDHIGVISKTLAIE